MIHCIGDSHTSFFSGEDAVQPEWPTPASNRLPQFRSYRLGAVLAYNLCKPNSTSGGREKLFKILGTLNPGSKVMLVSGEIDCRVHITRRWLESGGTPKAAVEPCLDRYCGVIDEIWKLGVQVLIWNVVPSSPTAPASRAVGTCRERNIITAAFNAGLRERWGEWFMSIPFGDGSDPDLYIDENHISQKVMQAALSVLKDHL